jgi:hypothetical protein
LQGGDLFPGRGAIEPHLCCVHKPFLARKGIPLPVIHAAAHGKIQNVA